MINALSLVGVGPSKKMEVKIAPRLNVLTGDNGAGKTFLLDVCWWAMTRNWPEQPAFPRDDVKQPYIAFSATGKSAKSYPFATYDPAREKWLFEKGRPIMPGLVVYVRINGGISVWDPARNYWKRPEGDLENSEDTSAISSKVGTYSKSEPLNFSKRDIWQGVTEGTRSVIKGLINHWIEWEAREKDLYQCLIRVLDVLSQHIDEKLVPGKPKRMSVRDDRLFPTLRMPYGDVPVTLTSSGMQRILALAYLLVWSWNEHLQASKLLHQSPTDRMLILFDEVEAHLHPKWQRSILPALLESINELRTALSKGLVTPKEPQIIVSTHSPLVLASLETRFAEKKDALTLLELENDDVKAKRIPWSMRGDVCAWLSSEVLGHTPPRSIPAEEAITKAKDEMQKPDLPNEKIVEIHNELRAVLKDTDPFWPRWLVLAEKAGILPS